MKNKKSFATLMVISVTLAGLLAHAHIISAYGFSGGS
jgi:hypothetical protein